MHTAFGLIVLGLAAVLIMLVIGVVADVRQSPHALAIITGALTAMLLLIRAIANRIGSPPNRRKRGGRNGAR